MPVAANMTMHVGRGCSLLTRTIVHLSRMDELINRWRSMLGSFVIGNPADPETTLGPLMSAAQRSRVETTRYRQGCGRSGGCWRQGA